MPYLMEEMAAALKKGFVPPKKVRPLFRRLVKADLARTFRMILLKKNQADFNRIADQVMPQYQAKEKYLAGVLSVIAEAKKAGAVSPVACRKLFMELAGGGFPKALKVLDDSRNFAAFDSLNKWLAGIRAVLDGKRQQIGCIGSEMAQFPLHITRELDQGHIVFRRPDDGYVEIYA